MDATPIKKKLMTGSDMGKVATAVATAPEALGSMGENEKRPLMWSTGCTPLNMALSDNPFEGWPVGRFVNIIGDSSSGKTFLALTALAEAANDSRFDDYDLIFDDIEEANTFDVRKLFGKKLADRMHAPVPASKGALEKNSSTVEEWYGHVMRYVTSGKPFIYVTDSIDAMSDAEELSRAVVYAKMSIVTAPAVKSGKKAALDGEEEGNTEETDEAPTKAKGSYKMGKAKMLSEGLRNIVTGIARTNSTVFAISQVRDNIDPRTSRFSPKVRAGGRALKFYATHEMWLSHVKNIMHSGAKLKIGDECLVKVSKNKVTGKQRSAGFNLYYSYGIDDIHACLSYLLANGAISISGRTIETEALLGKSGTKEVLVPYFENTPEALHKLRELVGKTWKDIEEKVQMNRRPKYE